MNRLEKFKGLSVKPADAAADISLINQFTVKELTPEDVYCFSLVLCDNEIDRDLERFTDKTLEKLAELFVGKTGISDHQWSANRQVARLYRVEVETTKEKNRLGQPLKRLRGSAYMMKNEANQAMIDAIEGGILKEVSVGCAVGKTVCSICGEPLKLDWRTWTYQCATGHIKGETYDGKLCVGNLEEPVDAYEFSFVAVPAQKGAGVTKGAQDPRAAFEVLATADLHMYADEIKKLMPRFQSALLEDSERAERAAIIKAAEAYQSFERKEKENDSV